jgi:hypothetical protein
VDLAVPAFYFVIGTWNLKKGKREKEEEKGGKGGRKEKKEIYTSGILFRKR